MTTVRIKVRTPLRDATGPRTRSIPAGYDEVELDELSPRARALAEAISHCPDAVAGTIRLRSDKRIRDVQPQWEAYFTPEQADQPLTMDWARWDRYPADSSMPAAEWLERQAAKIPPGWRIVGATPSSLGGEPLVQVDDSSTLMTAEAVVAYLATHGRYMTAASWRSKAHPSKGLAPEPADRVGRTPLWERADVDAWISGEWQKERSA
ncbi:hypothetical protein HII36_29660 [Nonomuraea sp. NN258]|uniref:hypothetical protein n=1 Tax=Nonomuraea antri TaxID=2730852 RepID=UPI001568DE2D|nr:hypothetical protein [Nonomuraea antri]NRQ35968.1 hypothetical protein [Nonomuraea antri]